MSTTQWPKIGDVNTIETQLDVGISTDPRDSLTSELHNNTSGYCRLRSGRLIGALKQIVEQQKGDKSADSEDESELLSGDLLSTVKRKSTLFSSSVNNNLMAEGINSLLPSPFYSRPEEDIPVIDFLKNVDLWSTLRKADEDSKHSALALLLKGNASAWYHT